MKNETEIVQKIIYQLKKQLPDVIIYKLNDRITAGIPDLVIAYRAITTWVEVKRLKGDETPSKMRKKFDALQIANNILLARQVPVFYFVAWPDGEEACIIRPRALHRLFETQPTRLVDGLRSRVTEHHAAKLSAVIDHLDFLCCTEVSHDRYGNY